MTSAGDHRDRQPVLQMRGISKRYPGARALDNASLEVRAGEVHVVLGENGAGKSTLMKILSGAVRADSGEILLDGHPVDLSSPLRARRLGISTIYQELSLVPHLSVAENIFLGKTPTRWGGVVDFRRMRADARRILDGLGVAIDCDAPVHSLRLAQQQMVEVARALSDDARLLVMDEPTSALSQREVGELFATIARLTSKGVAVVYISHRMDEVFRIGHRVTVLRDGCHVATRNIADVTAAELVRLMANREVAEHYPRRRHSPGEELLRVDRLHGGGLEDISFVLRRGEILGIAGLVGAGRTRLARALVGADPVDDRRIDDAWNGRSESTRRRMRRAPGSGSCRRIASSRGWCCGCPSSGTCRSRTSERWRGSASSIGGRSAAKPRTPSPACASGRRDPISWC